jgi:outer membrane biogenesis lipoprotein LolB
MNNKILIVALSVALLVAACTPYQSTEIKSADSIDAYPNRQAQIELVEKYKSQGIYNMRDWSDEDIELFKKLYAAENK